MIMTKIVKLILFWAESDQKFLKHYRTESYRLDELAILMTDWVQLFGETETVMILRFLIESLLKLSWIRLLPLGQSQM